MNEPQEEMETGDGETGANIDERVVVPDQIPREAAPAEETLPSLLENEAEQLIDPNPGIGQPDDTESQPEVSILQPKSIVSQPESTICQSETIMSPSITTLSPSKEGISSHDLVIPQLDETVSQPDATIPQSETTIPQSELLENPQPEGTVCQIDSVIPCVDTSVSQPESTVIQPETTIPQLETPTAQPETAIPQPKATFTDPEATISQDPVEESLSNPVDHGLPNLEADATNISDPVSTIVDNVTAAIQQPILISDIQQALAPLTEQSAQSLDETPMETDDIQEGAFPSLDGHSSKIVKMVPGHPTTDDTMMDDNDAELAAVLKEATNSLHLPHDQVEADTAALMMSEDEKPCIQEPIVIKPKTEPSAETDDLSTLAAAAALDQETNGIKLEEAPKKEPVWCDVGIIKGTSCFVGNYYEPSFTHDPEHENLTLDSLPDYTNS